MTVNLDAPKDLFDFPFLIDDECRSFDSPVILPVIILELVDAIFVGYLVFRIREEREIQIILRSEFRVRIEIVKYSHPRFELPVSRNAEKCL